MRSCCGIDCEVCEAYIATLTDNDALKEKVAKRWSDLYGKKIRPGDVNCRGCSSVGTKGIYCDTMCRIKPCCRKKGIDTCAQCPDFPCKDLAEVFRHFPDAEKRMKALRKKTK